MITLHSLHTRQTCKLSPYMQQATAFELLPQLKVNTDSLMAGAFGLDRGAGLQAKLETWQLHCELGLMLIMLSHAHYVHFHCRSGPAVTHLVLTAS